MRNLIIFIVILSTAFISFKLGWLYAFKNVKILYISQAEILDLEKARIKDAHFDDKQLFFGKPETAIKYIEEAQNHMSKAGSLVLLTDSKIYGKNVHSVSKEVHKMVIKGLEQRFKAE